MMKIRSIGKLMMSVGLVLIIIFSVQAQAYENNELDSTYEAPHSHDNTCVTPDTTEISDLTIDSDVINATPYWADILGGKTEQQAMLDYLKSADISPEKRDEWSEFLKKIWKRYPTTIKSKVNANLLTICTQSGRIALTPNENSTFSEIDRYINTEMQKSPTGSIEPTWHQIPNIHGEFIRIACEKENIPEEYRNIAIDSAPKPDTWWQGILLSENMGLVPAIPAIPPNPLHGFADVNSEAHGISSKSAFSSHDYDSSFEELGYSSHFLTDVGNPFHTPDPLIITFDQIYNDQTYEPLHNRYENMVADYWNSPFTYKGKSYTFQSIASSTNNIINVIDPAVAANSLATDSESTLSYLYYQCRKNYIHGDKPFIENSAIVKNAMDRVIITQEYTRGLVRYVTDGQSVTFTITANSGYYHGSIIPSGHITVNPHDNIEFTISPEPDYWIEEVKIDGTSVGPVPTYTFLDVTADHTIEASFMQPTNTREWNWLSNGWTGWSNGASWSGIQLGPCAEYGPVMDFNHGEHGADVNLQGGSVSSYVEQTFQDTSGTGWNTIYFKGLITPTDRPDGRWMKIMVNGQQVFYGTALQMPPGNGIPFEVRATFPLATVVTVHLSQGQAPAWGPRFAMEYNDLYLMKATAGSGVTQSKPVIQLDKNIIKNETLKTLSP